MADFNSSAVSVLNAKSVKRRSSASTIFGWFLSSRRRNSGNTVSGTFVL